MRILVVDDDASVLNTCCGWLIEEGCEVSTLRSPGRVLSCMRSARAEMVLIDPLMVNLSDEELRVLLTSCAHAGAPGVVLHSKLTPQLLSVVVDIRHARGVIKKTESAAEFLPAFRELAMHVWTRPAGARSGTHRIGDVDAGGAELVVLPLAGSSRRR
jgi:DNA-binding response OmpR family regulator